MNRKYLKIVLGFLIAALFVVPALAAPEDTEVRVVDLKVLGITALSDEELLSLARMDRLAKPELFPAISEFGIKVDSCTIATPETGVTIPDAAAGLIALSGMIEGSEPYRFASIADPAKPEVAPAAAVVKPDGSVMRLDEALGLKISEKTLTSTSCLAINPNDVVLLFTDEATPTAAPAAGPYGVIKEYNDRDGRRELKP